MGKSRVNYKTGEPPQRGNLPASRRRKSRISDYLRGKPKALKTTRVNETRQRNERIIWVMKWILLLPLSAYILVWFILLLTDFFKY